MKKFINKVLKKNTYFDRHINDILTTGVTVFLLICAYSYLSLKKRAQLIKREWNKYRCDPSVIPLAGFINAKPGSNFSDQIKFTIENNKICNNEILEESRNKYLNPVQRIQSNLISSFSNSSKSLSFVKSSFSKTTGAVTIMFDGLWNVMSSLVNKLQSFFIKIRNIFLSTIGIFLTTFYGYLGVLITNASIFFTTETIISSYLTAFSALVLLLQPLAGIPVLNVIYFVVLIVYVLQLILSLGSIIIFRVITLAINADKINTLFRLKGNQ